MPQSNNLFEGLVDISIELTLRDITSSGITNSAQVVVLAKAMQAAVELSTNKSKTFNELFQEQAPDEAVIHRIRGLSSDSAKSIALTVLSIVNRKKSESAVVTFSLASLFNVDKQAEYSQASE